MILNGAKAISTIQYFIAVVWLATFLATDTAYGDTFSAGNPLSRNPVTNSSSTHRIQCTGLTAAITFCGLDSDVYHDPYMQSAFQPHESIAGIPNDSNRSQPDLLAVLQLALEEFNLLSGLRLYWTHTERYIEHLAVRLKLKGEIFLSDPYPHARSQEKTRHSKSHHAVGRSYPPTGLMALITPHTIRWNMGMNPEDLSVFVDLHLNSHLSFSGEFGDENQVGLYFNYAF